jgi:chaperonin cofactor prefoldin
MTFTVGSPTGFAPPAVGEVFLPDVQSMSDESILELLRSRLRDVDGQIGTVTRTLQQQTAQAQALGQQAQRLNTLREIVGREPYMDVSNGNLRLDRPVEDADLRMFETRIGLSHGSLGHETLSLGEVMGRLTIGGQSMAGVTNREGLQLRADTLGEQIRECNSGNEQLMIKLQSAMQQRTQIVQMATNMLKAGDEARDAVVGNLR